MSNELTEAITALTEARPYPAAVKRLADETIARRETPYARLPISLRIVRPGIGNRGSAEMELAVCGICGAILNQGPAINSMPPFWPDQHLEWHNNQERRLRKLEERTGHDPHES